MATHDWPIVNFSTELDTTGDVFPNKIKNELSLANARGEESCIVMPAAATITADAGFDGGFHVPQNYVDTPLLVIVGILDGAPTTLVIAFGIQMNPRADDEAYDVAIGTQQIASASSVSQVDEDVYVETIDISGETFAAGDYVPYFFFIDDSVHTYTGKFLLTGLFFRYNDA